MPPIFYGCYKLGTWLLGTPAIQLPDKITLAWTFEVAATHWQPLYLGSFVAAVLAAIIGYLGTLIYWRWWVSRSWNRRLRKQKRARELREQLAKQNKQEP